MLYQGSRRVFKVLSKIVVHAGREWEGLHRGLDYAKEKEKFFTLTRLRGRGLGGRNPPSGLELFCGGGSLKWPHSAALSSPPSAPCLKCSRQSLRGTQHPFGSSRVVTLHRSFVVVQSKCIAGCLCYWNTVDCFKWLPLMPVFFLFSPPPSLLLLPRRTKNSDFTWCTSSPLCFARENGRMNCSHDGILLSIIVIIFD